jgi:hypothetical protein
MSDTQTIDAPPTGAITDDTVVQQPVADAGAGGDGDGNPPVQTTDAPDQAPPRPSPRDRRVAQLSARLGETSKELEAAQRRAEAAEALLRAAKGEPEPDKGTVSEAEIEARVRQRVAADAFNTRRAAVIAKGEQEFGKDAWIEKTTILGEMGAATNQTFLEALVELPNAPKIVAHLADDPDTLAELLRKSPTGMAAQLGRLDAQMERAAAPPPPKTVSSAPRPPNPIQGGAVLKEPDWTDPDQESKMSMAEWNAAFSKSDIGKRLLRRRG